MKYLKTYEERGGITFKEWLKKYPQDINTTSIVCGGRLIDLDGIQDFKNLEYLDCNYNNLTSLDLEGLDKLEELYCYDNNLTSLNLEGLDKLEILSCFSNNLTQLNLEGLDKLWYLNCYNNNLPYKDLKGYWKWWEKEYPDRVEAKKFNF